MKVETKKVLKADWSSERLRSESLAVIVAYETSLWEMLKKNPELIDIFETSFLKCRIKKIHELGINNPIDLVTYIGELLANLAGGTIEIYGNQNQAKLEIHSLAILDEIFKNTDFTDEDKQKCIGYFRDWVDKVASTLEYKADLVVADSLTSVTFSK